MVEHSRTIYKSPTITGLNQDFEVRDIEGRLKCNCPGEDTESTVWCQHIEHAMRNNLDAKQVDELWSHIVVPVIPTIDFHAVVGLGEYEDGFRSVVIESASAYKTTIKGSRVTLPTIEDVYLSFKDQPNSGVIGYITHGEGRMIIREMIVVWLRGHHRNSPNCRAKVHSRLNNTRWGKNDKREAPLQGADYQALWALLTHGMCAPCMFKTADTSPDVPEL